MKKLFAAVIAIAMLFSFAAMAETLKMGTECTFPPYEFYDESDEIVGIDAEIAALICEKLGYDLEIVDMAFDSLIPAVSSGKVDFVMAGLTVTPERASSVDFSASYAQGVQVVIVPEGSDITSIDDLTAEGASHKVGVQQGTTGDLYATWDIADAGLGSVEPYANGPDAVLALTSGKVDCVVIDNEPAKNYVAANEGLKILDTQYAVEDYAIALAKGSELTEKVNEALQSLIDDGTVAAVVEKYIPSK